MEPRTFKVYKYLYGKDQKVTCNLGCKHTVTYHLVKRLTEAPDEFRTEEIPYLNYDKPGIGTIKIAYDYQGRRYTQTPDWNGPGPWVRDDDEDNVFWTRPIVRMDGAFTIDGKPIV